MNLDNVKHSVSSALQIYKTREFMTCSEWADKYYYMSPESSSVSGKWTCLPYQRDILNLAGDDRCEQLSLIKPRCIGYTEMLKIIIGYFIEYKTRNSLIYQPTEANARDFTVDSIDTMIRDVEQLHECFKGVPGVKSKYNTSNKKVFKGCILDIRGGTTPANYRRMRKEVVGYDECDAFPVDIGGEGNCFKLGDGRLDDASFPKSIRGSTPGIKELSLIEPAVEESDIVLERYVPCPLCGFYHVLRFANLVLEDAEFECPSCKGRITYDKLPSMDSEGYYGNDEGVRLDPDLVKFFDKEGIEVPFPKKIGIKLWIAYSYFKHWSFFCQEWVSASKKSKSGDVTDLKAVINTMLGETWIEETESTEASAFDHLICDYTCESGIPNEVLVITCGVDIQGGKDSRIELEFLGHGLDNKTWSIDYKVINGDTTQDDVFYHLDDQFQRVFHRLDGKAVPVSAAFVDSGYLTDRVYRYCAKRKRFNIFATKGVITGTIPNKGTWVGDKKSGTRCILRSVNVFDCKTIFYKRIKKAKDSGKCHFPNNYPEKYYLQLANERKYAKVVKGRIVGYFWDVKDSYTGNEALDCRCYAMAAFNYLNVNMSRVEERL